MQFTPRSQKEIEDMKKPTTGIFPAHVHSAEARQAKKDGTDMIKLEITVFVGDKKQEKTTWLHPAMEVFVYNFAKNAGLLEEYQEGRLDAEMCEGKEVIVKLGIEKGKDGHEDRSVIRDFLPADTKTTDLAPTLRPAPVSIPKPPKDANLDLEDDSIPF